VSDGLLLPVLIDSNEVSAIEAMKLLNQSAFALTRYLREKMGSPDVEL
jgi:hypothetical protein